LRIDRVAVVGQGAKPELFLFIAARLPGAGRFLDSIGPLAAVVVPLAGSLQ